MSDKAWVQALGCRKNLETYTKYKHHILIFFILFVDKTLWNVPLAFLSNTFEQKFWIKRFTVTTFIIKTPLPSWHPNDTLKYVNAFEVSCSSTYINARYFKCILRSIFTPLYFVNNYSFWSNRTLPYFPLSVRPFVRPPPSQA